MAGITTTAGRILERFEYNFFYGCSLCLSSIKETIKQGFCITVTVRTSRYAKKFYFHKTSL
jgi:hypothetical protein